MKNKATFFTDLIMCITLISGLFYCLMTSFEIKAEWSLIIIPTAVFCTIYALLAALVKNSGTLFICIAVTMIVFVFTLLFSLSEILAQLSYVLTQIFKKYSEYFAVPESIMLGDKLAQTASALFVFVSAILSTAFTTSLIRFKKLFIIVPVSICMLIPCFLLINTLPSIISLFTVTAVITGMYISRHTRKLRPSQSGAVTVAATAVMLAVMSAILAFNPIESYKRYDWQENMLKNIQALFNIDDNSKNSTQKSIDGIKASLEKRKDLSSISNLEQTHTPKLTFTSEYGGLTYLKGTAYADYNNNSWNILSDSQAAGYTQEVYPFTMTAGTGDLFKSSVNMLGQSEIAYIPYFVDELPHGLESVADICIRNGSSSHNFSYEFYPFSRAGTYYSKEYDSSEKYGEFVYDTYLQIPDSTKSELQKIIDKNNLSGGSTEETIELVREYIGKSAAYSLDAPKMPSGQDFPIWFLNESDTGYCVHFATAGTLMLRTLGIPARFVTGYYFNSYANQTVTVTSDNAHAWVEYFDDEAGWIPFECTPSSFRPEQYTPQSKTVADSTNADVQESTVIPQPTTKPKENTHDFTSPVNNGDSNSTKNVSQSNANPTFIYLLAVVIILTAVVLFILLRRIIILDKRKKRFNSGDNNKRATEYYREILRLSNHSHLCITQNIRSIYEKARFSNHKISDDELKILSSAYYNSVEEICNNLSFAKKIYFKFIKVIN